MMRSTKMAKQNEETIAAYIGLDWADREHEVTMQVVETGLVESRKLKQESEALADWVESLRQRFSGRKVAIAVEQRKGALIYALMCYDFLILYPVNPKTLARFREAFNTSGAKSDPLDSQLLLDLIRLHRDKLRPWVPEDADTRLLQMLVEERRALVDDVTRLTNRLKSTLKQYFPQALEWAGELNSRQALDFLTRWPTLESIRKAGAVAVEKFYRGHSVRNQDKIEQRVKAIKEARALTNDRAVVAGSRMKSLAIVRQLRALGKSIAEMEAQIQELFEQHRDHEVFSSFPCAKKVLGPRLLAAFGGDRSRYESALELQSFSGIAPVTRSSGQSKTIHKRMACPKFLRQTFHEYAAQSIKKAGWASVYYQGQRNKGVKHHAAVRALAYKWIRIMFRCWQEQEPYNDAKYIASLKRRSSPLVSGLPPAASALVEV
jgi:transposase